MEPHLGVQLLTVLNVVNLVIAAMRFVPAADTDIRVGFLIILKSEIYYRHFKIMCTSALVYMLG